MEAAGVVEAVGADTVDVVPGDRVTYCMVLGSYAGHRVIDAQRLVKLPDDITDEQAAAMTLRGLTVHYLLKTSYVVRPGDTILIHAAAGGIGLIACQWAKHLGATVIGTVGSDQKADLARAHGCDHPIVYGRDSFVDAVAEITGGEGVPVVYDSVGKDTFYDSLDCLRRFGSMISFGQASGPIPPLEMSRLVGRGLWVTRAGLANHIHQRDQLVARAEDLFAVVGAGTVGIEIGQRYALADAANAHADLEGRRTTGSTILVP
jgi:NADPH2:quinone reductase